MTSRPSRTSPISILNGDGSIEPLHLRPAPFQAGFVVLAREKCLFEYFTVAAGVNARSAIAAARMHAETAAPFQRTATLITHKGQGFGIWWWDEQWVGERLAAAGLDPAARILPEPMVRAPGEGWRIVRASTGFEAQLWKQGFLVADQWRRTAFDAGAWQDFVRVQPDQTGADSAVLVAQEVPWTLQAPYRRMTLTTWTPERTTRFAIAASIAVLLCGSLYLVGDAIGLRNNTETLAAETTALTSKAPGGQAIQTELVGITALRTALGGPNVMQMLQKAQEVTEPYGYKIIAFDTSRQGLSITLPKEAVAELEGISRELMASGLFTDVRPALSRDNAHLTIAMTAKNARAKTKLKAAPRPGAA